MISRKPLAALLALAVTGSAVGAENFALSATECQVWERESSFAQSVTHHDAAAFAAHIAEGAVFGAASPQTQRGREAIVKAWLPLIEARGASIEWRPQFVSVTARADIAMSRGPYVITRWDDAGTKTYLIGQFVSVWSRKKASSPWLVMLDGGGPPPVAATEEEARRHLDAAPVTCPRG